MSREWIEHDGKDMPVDPYQRVEVMCRGFGNETDHADAGCYQFDDENWWVWSGSATDIIKYRKANRW